MHQARPEPRDDLLDHTLRVFQPRSPRPLTREDARQIVENMTGFFRVLAEWDRVEREQGSPAEPAAERAPAAASTPNTPARRKP